MPEAKARGWIGGGKLLVKSDNLVQNGILTLITYDGRHIELLACSSLFFVVMTIICGMVKC